MLALPAGHKVDEVRVAGVVDLVSLVHVDAAGKHQSRQSTMNRSAAQLTLHIVSDQRNTVLNCDLLVLRIANDQRRHAVHKADLRVLYRSVSVEAGRSM